MKKFRNREEEVLEMMYKKDNSIPLNTGGGAVLMDKLESPEKEILINCKKALEEIYPVKNEVTVKMIQELVGGTDEDVQLGLDMLVWGTYHNFNRRVVEQDGVYSVEAIPIGKTEASDIIQDARGQALQIIYDARKRASDIIQDAVSEGEQFLYENKMHTDKMHMYEARQSLVDIVRVLATQKSDTMSDDVEAKKPLQKASVRVKEAPVDKRIQGDGELTLNQAKAQAKKIIEKATKRSKKIVQGAVDKRDMIRDEIKEAERGFKIKTKSFGRRCV